MKVLHLIFELPMIFVAIWGIYNAQIAENGIVFSLWPFENEIHIKTQLLLFIFIVYGYIWGKINSWFNYSPVRHDLRMQKKANKVLNKEQLKLNETVSGLKQNIAGLQEQAKAKSETAEKTNGSSWLKFKSSIKKVFSSKNPKKGNVI